MGKQILDHLYRLWDFADMLFYLCVSSIGLTSVQRLAVQCAVQRLTGEVSGCPAPYA